MEWVETTGRTVEEALDAALDQLGVDATDAEYEVVEEPRVGLFGRLRVEARIRARVRPATPRPKEERRGRRKPAARSKDGATDSGGPAAPADAPPEPIAPTNSGGRSRPRPEPIDRAEDEAGEGGKGVSDQEQAIPLQEQGEAAARFLQGVLERFGAPAASVSVHEIEADTLEVRVEGDDLGLLIGPKGATLQALQELTRTAVQRHAGGRSGRLLVDVSGYRQRRRESLERFARKIADDVVSSGSRVVLEPMAPADRKVIHDTINDIPGVATSSEGEEPRRRVVVSPA